MKKGAAVLMLGTVLMASVALAAETAKSTQPATKSAATAKAAATEQMAKGAITAIDAAKKTVTVKGTTGTWTFETASTTKFYANKKAATMGDLKVGQQVSVHYSTKGDQKVASKITVVG